MSLPTHYNDMPLWRLVNLFLMGRTSGSGSLKDLQDLIRIKYEAIPEDERRYCLGDMDTKDSTIKEILKIKL